MILMTENLIFNALSHDVNAAQSRAFKAQRQASTGLKVMTADDDPVRAARASLLSSSLSSLESMGRVAAVAESQLSMAEGAITSSQELLMRARELAVMGANGSYNAEERQHIAEEAAVLHDTLLSLANTEVDGTFIFGGTAGVEPFAADGTYAGDDGVRQVDVAPGLRIKANVPGSSVFTVVGGQNVIGMLQNLATGLAGNDVQAVYNVIDQLDRSMDQLNNARCSVGGSLAEAAIGTRQRTDTNILLRKDRSDTVEIDQAEALIRMMEAQTAYQTALAEAARILGQLQNNPLAR
jgi:flagellar hook-associated protein 3 FlgL